MAQDHQSEASKASEDKYDPEEAQRRFEALVRAALTTRRTPMKDIPKKRKPLPRKAGKGSSRAGAGKPD